MDNVGMMEKLDRFDCKWYYMTPNVFNAKDILYRIELAQLQLGLNMIRRISSWI